MTSFIIPGVALVALAFIGLMLIMRRVWRGDPQAPVTAKKAREALADLDTVAAWPPQATRVLSISQLRVYSALRIALPDYIVLAQLPLSRFMKVSTRRPYSEWLRRVGFLSVDFLVCDAQGQPVGAIEIRSSLRRRDHERATVRQERIARVLKAVDIPLHVWGENHVPRTEKMRDIIIGRMPADAQPYTLESQDAQETRAEHKEPSPSTWFHDLDSGAVPLGAGPGETAAKPS